MTQVIVLNGGSSSGKSSIARALQEILPGLWLTFGVDVLIEALPGRGEDPRSGLVLEPDGTVTARPTFRAAEDIWYQGLATLAHHGAFLILDEVLLTGGAGQQRLRALLGGLDVLWAGVHCDPLVASDREATRPDRVRGMAMKQAVAVHVGVVYDVEVDTTECSAAACARRIAEDVTGHQRARTAGKLCSPVVAHGQRKSPRPGHGPVSGYASGAEEGPGSVPGSVRRLRSRW